MINVLQKLLLRTLAQVTRAVGIREEYDLCPVTVLPKKTASYGILLRNSRGDGKPDFQ
jgi:hypothetical protein